MNSNAINSVKQFSGNPNIEIKPDGYEHTPHADYIIFFDKNDEYWVNSDTYGVDRYSSYGELDNCRDVRISQESAQLIAESFIKAHDEQTDLKNYSLVMNKFVDGGDINTFNFLWRKYFEEIETPNCFFISINPTTGAIIHYISINQPISISLENKITQEEADFIALKQFPEIKDYNSDSKLKVRYDDYGFQRLIWECSISESLNGYANDYIMQGGIVHIDAQTGEIIRIFTPM